MGTTDNDVSRWEMFTKEREMCSEGFEIEGVALDADHVEFIL